MIKTMAKRGNPLFGTKYKNELSVGEDKPSEVFNIRVPDGTKAKLKEKFGDESNDKVREAIARLLDDE